MKKVFFFTVLVWLFAVETSSAFVTGPKPDKNVIQVSQDKINGKWGILNAEGKWIVKAQFDKIWKFSKNDLAKVLLDGKYGFINRDGKWIIEPQFTEALRFDLNHSFIAVKTENGKWGVMNIKGKWIVKPRFDTLEEDSFDCIDKECKRGLIYVTHDSKKGIISTEGEWIIKQYDDVLVGQENMIIDINGWIKVKRNNKWGVIDTEGKWIFKPQFTEISSFTVKDLLTAKKNGKWGFIDARGKWVIEPKYDEIYDYPENDSIGGMVRVDDKWGFMSYMGEWLLEPVFDKNNQLDIYAGYDNLKKVGLIKVGDRYSKIGLMDRKGQWVLKQKFDDIKVLDDRIYVKFGEKEGYVSFEGKYLTFTEDELKEEEMKQSCKNGNAIDCYTIAHIYDKGKGFKRNKSSSKKLLWEACRQGIANGCYALGDIYAYKQSKTYDSEKFRHYPFVCYRKKSKNDTGKIIYEECIRSKVKCSAAKKVHFGEYPNDLKTHEAFERCIEGYPRSVDWQ